jgi:hypothetical protein
MREAFTIDCQAGANTAGNMEAQTEEVLSLGILLH